MALDPLSDVLALLKPRSYISAGLDAGGAWSIHFPGHDGIKFNAVLRGACWVSVEGDADPQRLEQGDCFLLTRGRPFILCNDRSLEPVPSDPIYAAAENGGATCNGGGDFLLVGGRFAFDGDHATALFGVLPPVVRVHESSADASVLRWSLDQLALELKSRQPGGSLVAEHLAHIMLVRVLRLYLAGQNGAGVGWLYALSDRQMAAAIGAMHANPAHRWTLQELASLAGMSRSTFAERFKRMVGAAPMEYLTQWRMLVAGDKLRNSGESIAKIALSLGYESESAFGTAFRRTMLCSPRQYQREKAKGS